MCRTDDFASDQNHDFVNAWITKFSYPLCSVERESFATMGTFWSPCKQRSVNLVESWKLSMGRHSRKCNAVM